MADAAAEAERAAMLAQAKNMLHAFGKKQKKKRAKKKKPPHSATEPPAGAGTSAAQPASQDGLEEQLTQPELPSPPTTVRAMSPDPTTAPLEVAPVQAVVRDTVVETAPPRAPDASFDALDESQADPQLAEEQPPWTPAPQRVHDDSARLVEQQWPELVEPTYEYTAATPAHDDEAAIAARVEVALRQVR